MRGQRTQTNARTRKGPRKTVGVQRNPNATVIVVSEDGPVTVMRGGHFLGASAIAAPETSGDLLSTGDLMDDMSLELE